MSGNDEEISAELAASPYSVTYRTKEELIAAFDALVQAHPGWAVKQIIGNSVGGKPIPMYRFGIGKGKIMIDNEMHGTEDMAGELALRWLEHLFNNAIPHAPRILCECRLYIIPVVNIDRYGRTNLHKVNINRNFVYNWGTSGSGDPDDPKDDYRGPSAASEPETQAMIGAFKEKKPDIYINTHMFGGPWNHCYNVNSCRTAWVKKARSDIEALCNARNINPFNFYISQGLLGGYAIGDSAKNGCTYPLLWELTGKLNPRPSIEDVEKIFLPIWEATLEVLCLNISTGLPFDPPPATEFKRFCEYLRDMAPS